LRASVDATLTPQTAQAFPPFESGARFGTASPSLDLHAVRQKYTDCLDAATDQLDTSSHLVDVVSEIAARYGSIDGLASAPLADLQDAFVAAARDDQTRQFGDRADPGGSL
jgi:hypothetical protein